MDSEIMLEIFAHGRPLGTRPLAVPRAPMHTKQIQKKHLLAQPQTTVPLPRPEWVWATHAIPHGWPLLVGRAGREERPGGTGPGHLALRTGKWV